MAPPALPGNLRNLPGPLPSCPAHAPRLQLVSQGGCRELGVCADPPEGMLGSLLFTSALCPPCPRLCPHVALDVRWMDKNSADGSAHLTYRQGPECCLCIHSSLGSVQTGPGVGSALLDLPVQWW